MVARAPLSERTRSLVGYNGGVDSDVESGSDKIDPAEAGAGPEVAGATFGAPFSLPSPLIR
jgi:hypothetical protein